MLPKDRGRSPVSCIRAFAYVSKLMFVRRTPAVFRETGGGVGGMRPEGGSFLPPPCSPRVQQFGKSLERCSPFADSIRKAQRGNPQRHQVGT